MSDFQASMQTKSDEIVPTFSTDIKHTFKLFLPIFLGQLAGNCMSVVDTVMAGAAGTIQLSGVAIGASFYWPCVLFVVGMTLAIQPTVAQLRGAGKIDQIPKKLHLATVICVITSIIIGILMCFLPLCYKLMSNIDEEMVRVGQGYLIAVATGMPAIAMFNILRGYWEGLGNTVPTLIFGFIALFLNIPLNYIFIFGKFGVPAFGGIGCGIATSITIYICVIGMLIFIKKHSIFARFRIYERSYPISWSEVKTFLHFAFPLALSTTIEVTCFSLVAVLLSPFGPVTVASHSIAMNVSGIIFMLPLSIGSAATIRVGEAIGAVHWNRALRAALGALIIGGVLYVICLLGLIIGNEFIISLYTKDAEVMSLASILLVFCTFFLFPDSLQAIAIGIVRGFKDSKTIFVITVLSYWIIGMPIGYSLAYGLITEEPWGAQGFWLGFICALSCASLLYVIRIVHIFKNRVMPKSLKQSIEEIDTSLYN